MTPLLNPFASPPPARSATAHGPNQASNGARPSGSGIEATATPFELLAEAANGEDSTPAGTGPLKQAGRGDAPAKADAAQPGSDAQPDCPVALLEETVGEGNTVTDGDRQASLRLKGNRLWKAAQLAEDALTLASAAETGGEQPAARSHPGTAQLAPNTVPTTPAPIAQLAADAAPPAMGLPQGSSAALAPNSAPTTPAPITDLAADGTAAAVAQSQVVTAALAQNSVASTPSPIADLAAAVPTPASTSKSGLPSGEAEDVTDTSSEQDGAGQAGAVDLTALLGGIPLSLQIAPMPNPAATPAQSESVLPGITLQAVTGEQPASVVPTPAGEGAVGAGSKTPQISGASPLPGAAWSSEHATRAASDMATNTPADQAVSRETRMQVDALARTFVGGRTTSPAGNAIAPQVGIQPAANLTEPETSVAAALASLTEAGRTVAARAATPRTSAASAPAPDGATAAVEATSSVAANPVSAATASFAAALGARQGSRSGDTPSRDPGDGGSAIPVADAETSLPQPAFPVAAAPTPAGGAAAASSSNAASHTGHGAAPTVSNVTLAAVPVEIGMKSLAGINQFNIRLAPDDLGQIDVKLHIDEAGRVKAHLTVDRPETLGFLQRDAAKLQQALEQAGLTTQDGGIALSLRNSGSDAGGGQNRNQPGDQQPQGGQVQAQIDQTRSAEPRPDSHNVRLLWPRASGVDLHI